MEQTMWGFVGALVGTVIGGGVSILTTLITNRTAHVIQSAKIREEVAEKARQFQRVTLIELQEALLVHTRLVARAHLEDLAAFRRSGSWQKNLLDDDLNESLRASNQKLAMLLERLASDELRRDLKVFRGLLTAATISETEDQAVQSFENASARLEDINQRIGEALRSYYSAG